MEGGNNGSFSEALKGEVALVDERKGFGGG